MQKFNFDNYCGFKTTTIDKHQIEKEDNYKHLGKILKMQDTTKKEIMSGIGGGLTCFGMNKELLPDKEILMPLLGK